MEGSYDPGDFQRLWHRRRKGGDNVAGRFLKLIRKALLGFLNPMQMTSLLIPQKFFLETCLDPSAKKRRVKRLWKKIFGSGFNAAHDSFDFVDRRYHDDWQMPQLWIGLHAFQDKVALHLWHGHVKQDEIERLSREHRDSTLAVFSLGGAVPLALQMFDENVPVLRLIIHDEDAPGDSRSSLNRKSVVGLP